MSRAPTILVALLTLLAGAAVVWLLMDEAPRGAEGPQAGPSGQARTEGGPTLKAASGSHMASVSAMASRLVGTVTLRGLPVQASIQVYRLGSFPFARQVWQLDPGRWRNAPRPLANTSAVAQARCDEAGTFEVAGLRGGLYRVVARHGGRRGTCGNVFLRADGRAVEVRIALAAHVAEIRGTVRYRSGRPWRGRVHATPTNDRKWWAGLLPGDAPGVETDAEGQFVLTHVPYGPVRLHALDPTGLRVLSDRHWIPHQGSAVITVPDPDSWVDVRVVSAEDGAPISEAVVLAAGYTKRPSEDVFLSTRTNESGSARVPMGGEYVSVRVEASGWSRADVAIYPGDPGALVTLSRTARVHGTVVNKEDGAPIPGLAVMTWGGSMAITNMRGQFELSGVHGGSTLLRTNGQGWIAWSVSGVDGAGWWVYPQVGSTHVVELVASRGSSWKGRVLGADGAPIQAAVVYAHSGDSDDLDSDVQATGVTDAAGLVTLSGLSQNSTYGFRAEAAGYATAVSPIWKASKADTEAVSEIHMQAGRRIEVRVRDDRGSPLPGVRVAIKGREPSWAYRVTGDDGWAYFDNVPPTKLEVWVRCAGFEVVSKEIPAAVSDAAEREVIEISVGPAAIMRGHVYWEDGSPAREIDVKLSGLDKSSTCDEHGAFRFEWVPDGQHELVIKAEHVEPAETFTQMAAYDDEAIEIRLALPPPEEEVEVELLIVDERGNPVGSAEVDAFYAPGQANTGLPADNGSLRLKGGWTSLLIHDPASSTSTPLPLGALKIGPHDGAPVTTAQLPAELVIAGIVRAEDGAPAGGVYLSITGEDQHVEAVRSDATGAFRIGRLAAGPVELSAASVDGLLATSVSLQAGDQGVDLTLRREAPVTLRILDADGAPMAKARVSWSREDPGEYDDHKSGDAHTNQEGIATPRGLDPEGRYTLSVSVPSGIDALAYRMSAWAPTSADIRLRPSFRVEGLVVDQLGQPVAGVMVEAEQKEEEESVLTDAEGFFSISGLRPGDVLLRTHRQNSQSWRSKNEGNRHYLASLKSEPVTLRAGTHGVRLEVDVGLPIRVRVQGWSTSDSNIRAILIQQSSVEDSDGNEYGGSTMAGKPWFDNPIPSTGLVHFKQARPGARFSLWIGPLADGRYVLESGLVGRNQVYDVTPRRGGVFRGQIECPADVKATYVTVSGDGWFASGDPDEHGGFEFDGLPRGAVTVKAWGHKQSGETEDPWADESEGYAGEATGRVGRSMTVHLKKEDG